MPVYVNFPYYIAHDGVKRRSGHYKYGTGKIPYQHEPWFSWGQSNGAKWLSIDEQIRKQNGNLSEKERIEKLSEALKLDKPMTIREYRAQKSVYLEEKKLNQENTIANLKEIKQMSFAAIAEQMGLPEPTVRSIYNNSNQGKVRANQIKNTTDEIRKRVDEIGFVDIGTGVNARLGISETKMGAVKKALKEEGYTIETIYVDMLGAGGGKKQKVTVLAEPGTTVQDIYKNIENIGSITDIHTNDGGETYYGIKPPKSLDSKRIQVRYAEEGGLEMDGVVQLRRGVEDISLGSNHHAQVRIAVDDTHYIKGMAIYSDDMPDGIDVIVNTNKAKGTPLKAESGGKGVLKPMTNDPDNPFGAQLKKSDKTIFTDPDTGETFTLTAGGQREYIDKNGDIQLSCINKVNEEGDWDKWSRRLSSQFLSKQTVTLAKEQLGLAKSEKQDEFEEIKKITNPAIKKSELIDFAENCDKAASELKAHAMPGQTQKVLLPVPGLKDNECYCPTVADGTEVILIRHPHGGTYELPRLVVNNKHKQGKLVVGDSIDAIGINPTVAATLSGADFDGDSVIVIPDNEHKVKTSRPIKELVEFEPKRDYKKPEGARKTGDHDGFETQMQMGLVSNLITDMQQKDAPQKEMVRAIKHSMVVIDAEKHNLDWQRSAADNDIESLKKKYQMKPDGTYGGASTLISRASSEKRVDERKMWTFSANTVNPETGEKIYTETGRTYQPGRYDSEGNWHPVGGRKKYSTSTTKMAEAKDARELLSDYNEGKGSRMEQVYADYANSMKQMANDARKEALGITAYSVNPSARKVYAKQVASLKAKYQNAISNAPLERQAQLAANVVVKDKVSQKKAIGEKYTKKELTKIRQQAITAARDKYNARGKESRVDITPEEWEAIDAFALPFNTVSNIIKKANSDQVKAYARPRTNKTMTATKEARIKMLYKQGFDIETIAQMVGVSASTISNLNLPSRK